MNQRQSGKTSKKMNQRQSSKTSKKTNQRVSSKTSKKMKYERMVQDIRCIFVALAMFRCLLYSQSVNEA
jgi:hypothetical protein